MGSMMSNKWLWAVVIIAILYFGNIAGFGTWINTQFKIGQAPVIPGVPTTPTVPAGQVYTGPISLTVTDYWAHDSSSLALTNAVIPVYHKDLVTIAHAGLTLGTAAVLTQLGGDNGILYIVVEDKTQTVGYVDPALTVQRSGGLIPAYTLKDIDSNGQMDLVFTLDISGLAPLTAGETSKPVNIALYSWKAQTNSGALVSISSPTGMNTAGDYHATGYYGTWSGEGWQLRLVKAQIAPKNTTGDVDDKFEAGTLQLKAFTFRGMGSSGVVYGAKWEGVNYDAAQDIYLWYQANWSGSTDVTQVNYGMPFKYERQSGASWLQFDISIHTSSGTLTASSKYYITITLTFAAPDASTFTETLDVTLTG